MKNFKKILFILICILLAFIGGMFFMNKQTEPEITSTGSLTLTNSQNRQKSFKYGFFYVKFLFFDVVCVVYL